jgi:hypothetical protein
MIMLFSNGILFVWSSTIITEILSILSISEYETGGRGEASNRHGPTNRIPKISKPGTAKPRHSLIRLHAKVLNYFSTATLPLPLGSLSCFPLKLLWNYGPNSRWDSLDGEPALSQGRYLHRTSQTKKKRGHHHSSGIRTHDTIV